MSILEHGRNDNLEKDVDSLDKINVDCVAYKMETIEHLLPGYKIMASGESVTRHIWALMIQLVHWAKKCSLVDEGKKW